MLPLFQPVGDLSVRVAFGDEISPQITRRIHRFCHALEAEPPDGVTEWVPGYAAVTVTYQPWKIAYNALCRELERRAKKRFPAMADKARLVEIPVCYGGEFGPDLEEVAAAHDLTPAQVIQRHTRPLYRVYFLGFLPGFAYLGGLPPALATPRRATPRQSVPAGAVGIAGAQTGVYPLETPGGWQIIGRTPLRLYDPDRQPPALLSPGDRVRFVAVTTGDYEKLAHAPH